MKKEKMKKIAFIIVAVLGMLAFGSCASDDGNYDYIDLPQFEVDTTGVQTSFTIPQFSKLSIPSHLKYAGDKSELKYVWSIYKNASGQDDLTVDTLATGENLDETIRVAPGNYIIEFMALNPNTGLRAMMQYNVNVESSLGTGLMVMYQKADGSAELGIIRSNLFAGGLVSESIETELFKRANPSYNLKGTPRLFHIAPEYYIIIATDKDAVSVSIDDMTIINDFKSMFFTEPEVCDIKSAMYMYGFDALVNQNGVHTCINSWAADGEYYFSGARNGDYEIAPNIVFAYGINVFGYDQKNMRFVYGGMWDSSMVPFQNNTSAFDFGNVGKKMIYMDYAYGTTSNEYGTMYLAYSVMKNPVDDGSRYIYVADISNSSTSKYVGQGIIDITACTDIANAQQFAFGRRGPVAFYNTKNAVYQINYELSGFTCTGSTKVLSTADEITCMQMFTADGLSLEASANSKYLLVSTYNSASDESKLNIYECDLASGKLSDSPVQSYTVKGKITRTEFKNS